MVQQQQQSMLKPVSRPRKVGGPMNKIGKAAGKMIGGSNKNVVKKGGNAIKGKIGSKPTFSKVSNSVRKTMGY